MAKLLLENGAKHNIKDIDGNEPIHYASVSSHSKCLEILIQHGAHVNTRGEASLTPLQIAINASRTVNVRILLSYGATLDSKDRFFPMERAMVKKKLDIFKLLLSFESLTKLQ